MERDKTYEKYGKKALEPVMAALPVAKEVVILPGRIAIVLLSAFAASRPGGGLQKIGDFGLRHALPKRV
jgi:hypothetical protein